MSKITLQLTIDEVNGLLNTLAQLPFIQSVGFINLIQNQATPQVATMPKEENSDESTSTS